MAKALTKRCAIYTRKSSEEGLEQEYNSLHAQRDAAEAFVRSQKHEGWRAIKQSYDDGGISGGHLDRPGLQLLLQDIKAGRIDVVVVYKVDRLSRSLSDFARLMELFEKHEVSFVSVTQQFNTSTSMGRLTLNVLLSFAQFEREVTGERIRDKIALSKKKGKWMGGIPPLGYDVVDRKLEINDAEAEVVRTSFQIYLDSSGLIQTVQELNRRGLKTKHYVSAKGRVHESKPWVAKQLHRLLCQPIYQGKVQYRGDLFDGEHEGIIDPDQWKRVQDKLRKSDPESRKTNGHSNQAAMDRTQLVHPLKGYAYSIDGSALSPTYTNKSTRGRDGGKEKRRYRYYVSQQAIQRGDRASPVTSLNATVLESTVRRILASGLPELSDAVSVSGLTDRQVQHRMNAHASRTAAMESPGDLAELVRVLAPKIVIGAEDIQIHLPLRSLALLVESSVTAPHLKSNGQIGVSVSTAGDEALLVAAVNLSVCRGRAELVDSRTGKVLSPSRSKPNPSLIRILAQAEYWRAELARHPSKSLAAILKPRGIRPRYVSKVLNAAYLAPAIKRAILQGTQPPELQAQDLLVPRPMDWEAQMRELGIPSVGGGQ